MTTPTQLPLTAIFDNPLQPRLAQNDEVTEAARVAMEDAGGWPATMPPLLVRPRAGGGYELLAGHHRTAAARLAGLATVPAQVEQLDDRAAAIALVTSNNQTAMSTLEHGRYALHLQERDGITVAEYARLVGKSEGNIYMAIKAWKVLEAHGGPDGPYAGVSAVALAALAADDLSPKRAMLLSQFAQRGTSAAKATEVLRLVREGRPMREAFDQAEGRIGPPKPAGVAPGGRSSNASMATGGASVVLSHHTEELIRGFEWTLALYQAKTEEYEARFGEQLQGAAKDAFLEAVHRRHRQLVAQLQENPKPLLASPPVGGAKPPKCSSCYHAKKSSLSKSGYRCGVSREDECMPHTKAACWVAADDEDGAA